ncbi:Myb/SANT-like DNA-binding domain-containing protein [Forsythia ovata]|uniref:Myb/SANT-like DNA-binding domain-containing protein n=1 Tax=Forsythia ovata TaxID=205694 RepID=A0ABD1UU21_9LAMI
MFSWQYRRINFPGQIISIRLCSRIPPISLPKLEIAAIPSIFSSKSQKLIVFLFPLAQLSLHFEIVAAGGRLLQLPLICSCPNLGQSQLLVTCSSFPCLPWFSKGLYREVVTNATINNSPYDKDYVKQWYSFFQLDLMAHQRHNTASPFQVPRPTTSTTMDENDTNSTQVDPSTKIRQVRWNDNMDGFMIIALVNQVLVGHKRSDNGFTSFQISKAMESVKQGCGMGSRLKTLKREYAEVSQLLSISGFGWDAETGRITVDSLAWEELVKGKPDFGKWRSKLCRRYDDMECIFENDTATGDREVSGFDNFSPMQVDDSVNELDTPTEDTDPSPTPSRKRGSEEGTSTGRRKRTKPHDDESHRTLALIAESSRKIADAIHMQATLDTLNHVNWQLITEKLEAMDLDLVDIMKVMKAFRSDGDLAKVFMSLTNTTIMRALVYEQLGRDPPPLP